MWGIFFGEFQCLLVDDCSAVSCDSAALARGNEGMSFYSAILNQSLGAAFDLNHLTNKTDLGFSPKYSYH